MRLNRQPAKNRFASLSSSKSISTSSMLPNSDEKSPRPPPRYSPEFSSATAAPERPAAQQNAARIRLQFMNGSLPENVGKDQASFVPAPPASATPCPSAPEAPAAAASAPGASAASMSSGSAPPRTMCSAIRYAAAFHDCPAMPRGSNVRPCSHSANDQPSSAQARASATSSAPAASRCPARASAAIQNPPIIGQMPPL